jgi:cytochrome b
VRSTPAGRVRIWDPLVRLLHWSLAGTFAASWLTRHSAGAIHEWLGYAVLGIVLLRLVWGLLGSRYARFAQFVRWPAATLRYARALAAGGQPRYLGHNPLGAWMIVALILTTLGICISGWLYTTDRYWGVEWVETVHRWLTNFGLVLVGLHVAGVVVTSLHDRENLVAAMLHGRKREPGPGDMA